MPNPKIAIIIGGPSNEREVSLKSGEQVWEGLNPDKFEKSLIEISKTGQWLLHPNPTFPLSPENTQPLTIFDPQTGFAKNDLQQFDLLFLALHGTFGEDGQIQGILDALQIPFHGSGVAASALAMDKFHTQNILSHFDFKVPKALFLHTRKLENMNQVVSQIQSEIGLPCVIKPNSSGSSVGISLVKTPEEIQPALQTAANEDKFILIQAFIPGQELTCGVLGNSHQTDLTPLPPVQIISANEFFDFDAKYFSKDTQEICPAKIPPALTQKIQDLAKKAHLTLGCDGLSRSDFIISDDDGELYFLETNTLPGLTPASLCPKEAKAAGLTFSEFLEKQINLALQKHK